MKCWRILRCFFTFSTKIIDVRNSATILERKRTKIENHLVYVLNFPTQFGVPYRIISLVEIDLFIAHDHSAVTFHLTDFSRKSADVTHKKIQSLKFFCGASEPTKSFISMLGKLGFSMWNVFFLTSKCFFSRDFYIYTMKVFTFKI